MPLDRHQQVARVWDWLPAFRAAAEYESLQRASLAVSVSASALSRSIRLLEDTLGVPLFVRSPGGMTLTIHGQQLLAATRDAMRRIHDAIPTDVPHRLRAGAVGPGLQRLLGDAAVDALPDWTLAFSDVAHANVGEALRCGDLDYVLSHASVPGAEFRVEALPPLDLVVAVGPGGDPTRVASLDVDGFAWPGAAATAADFGQLLSVAERLHFAAYVPKGCLPATWTLLDGRGALPVFAIVRAYSDPPPFLEALTAAVRRRLEAPR